MSLSTPTDLNIVAVSYTHLDVYKRQFEYLTWVLTQMPNLGKPGYAASVEELLPGSTVLPEKVFAPTSKKEPKQYAWEEQQ